jgi:asparagine synthase (glutamine-hydrolysing)
MTMNRLQNEDRLQENLDAYLNRACEAEARGDIDEAEPPGSLARSVVIDLRPAQRARAVEIDGVPWGCLLVWPSIGDVCKAYEETLHAQAGPFSGGSVLAQHMVFKTARAAGFKVLLGGQGGDEAFMGYRKFQLFRLRQLMAKRRYLGALGFAMSLLPTFFAERSRWFGLWSTRDRYLKRLGMTTILRLPDSNLSIGYSPLEPLRARQIRDVTAASLPTLLRFEDSNSMGNSIESRLPFVDYRVVEYGVALPEALKLRGGYGKWIVRRAVAGKIPEAIRTARYKRGFDVQQDRWIDEGLGAFVRKMLHDQLGTIQEWLAPGTKIGEAFSNHQFKARPSAFAEATTLLWLAQASNPTAL